MPESPTVQRSVRLSRRTAEMLDAAAAETTESRNALTDRLLGDALRLERHPFIRMRTGPAGHRRPSIVGTRISVNQVMSTLRSEGGDLDAAAEYFDLASHLIRAAVDYYADFADELDADAAADARLAEAERDRWERQQRALA